MKRALKWVGGGCLLLLSCAGVAIIVGPPKVPPEAIASSVDRTDATMDAAFALPTAATYGRELHWQQNGSTCGPASLVNVRRSLGLSADDESEVLADTDLCWTGMCIPGVTLDELAEIAQSKGDVEVTVLRDLSEDEFLEHLRQSNDPAQRYVVNFSRKPIFGHGGGHHSPIGGYLEDEDLVLVLDVNHDFQPWLIERERLFAAMDTVDGMAEKKRGLLRIESAN
jgi:hypothetical protein